MTKPGSLNSKLANWVILLSQYGMTFVPQKVIKSEVISDILGAHPLLETPKLHENIPNEVKKLSRLQTMKFSKCSLTVRQEWALKAR